MTLELELPLPPMRTLEFEFPPLMSTRELEVVVVTIPVWYPIGGTMGIGVLMPFALGYATLYISFSPALYIVFIGFIGIIMGIYFYNLPEFRKINEVI